MRELGRIFLNEWMKLLRRKRLWVAAIMGLCVVGLFSLIGWHAHRDFTRQAQSYQDQLQSLQQEDTQLKQQDDTQSKQMRVGIEQEIGLLEAQLSSENWQPILQSQLASEQQSIQHDDADAAARHIAPYSDHTHALMTQYALSHNVKPMLMSDDSAYQQFSDYLDILARLFLPLLVVVIAADMVSGETTSGTIKLLLVRPASRGKILFAKWLTTLLATVLMTLAVCAAMMLAELAIFGTKGALQPQVVGVGYATAPQSDLYPGQVGVRLVRYFNHASVLPIWEFLLISALFVALAMMVVASITFLSSTLFKSAMAGTGVSMGLVVFGYILVEMSQRLNMHSILGVFSAQLNPAANWSGRLAEQLYMSAPLSQGLLVLLLWGVLSYIIAFVIFRRRDVLNA